MSHKKECKECKKPKDPKDFRKNSRVCRVCISEKDKAKRAERWSYLGLDMSTKY